MTLRFAREVQPPPTESGWYYGDEIDDPYERGIHLVEVYATDAGVLRLVNEVNDDFEQIPPRP